MGHYSRVIDEDDKDVPEPAEGQGEPSQLFGTEGPFSFGFFV